MKSFFTLTLLVFVLSVGHVSAQSKLTDEAFWKSNPNLDAVKTEAKGFNFKEAQKSSDPIVLAIKNKASKPIFEYLLSLPGVDITHLIFEGRIYLHLAANASLPGAVDALLDKGSDMYFLDANDHTAFTFAGYQGHLTPEVIDVFIKHGIDLDKKYDSKNGSDILLLSIPYDKDLVVSDYLISKGLSIHTTDNDGNTAFDHAAQIGYVSTMKALIKRGVKYTPNALIFASKGTYRSANTIEVFKYLVDDLNIDPKTTSNDGKNVLHNIANKRDQAEIVSYFLNKGVDVNKTDDDGNTPFMNAAGKDSYEVVQLMAPKFNFKTINAKNTKGETALLKAVAGGNEKTVAFLIEKGADINITDTEGNTLVYYLTESFRKPRGRSGGNISSVLKKFEAKLNTLKKAGLDFTKVQNNHQTLWHLAVAKNNVDLLKTLKGFHVDINAKNSEGNTALHQAALIAEDDAVLKYLLSIGAKKDIETEFGETAYDLAKENEMLKKKHVNIDFLKA